MAGKMVGSLGHGDRGQGRTADLGAGVGIRRVEKRRGPRPLAIGEAEEEDQGGQVTSRLGSSEGVC